MNGQSVGCGWTLIRIFDRVSELTETATRQPASKRYAMSPKNVWSNFPETKALQNPKIKVHPTPKYFFRSNKSLHLFEMHCAFLPLLNPNLDFLQAVKVTKSGHHLLHDRLFCMHVYKDLIWCKSVCDVNPGIDPYPLLARSCNRWWPDFLTFTACKKSRFGLKRGKKAQCVSNRCKDLFWMKKVFWGWVHFKVQFLIWFYLSYVYFKH